MNVVIVGGGVGGVACAKSLAKHRDHINVSLIDASARDDVAKQGIPAERIGCRRTMHVKVEGTDTTIEVPAGALRDVVAEFERRYAQQYGFLMPGKALVIEAVAVEAVGRTESAGDRMPAFAPRAGALARIATHRVYTAGEFREAAVYAREDLRPGDAIPGPAIVKEPNATTVVEPGWRATLTPRDDLVLERVDLVEVDGEAQPRPQTPWSN